MFFTQNKKLLTCLAISLVLFNADDIAQTHNTGLLYVTQTAYAQLPKLSTTDYRIPVGMVDLSQWFPSPGSQESINSCVGWAVSYLKSFNENFKNNTHSFSFSPSYIYNQIKMQDCMGGSYLPDALNLLTTQGCAQVTDFPYTQNCSIQPATSTKNNATQYAPVAYYALGPSDLYTIKASLNNSFPVLIGIDVDNAFSNYQGGIFSQWNDVDKKAHAMVVVGYDDSRKALKVINSWGTTWGGNEHGYCWISYVAFARNVHEAYTIYDKSGQNDALMLSKRVNGAVPFLKWVHGDTQDIFFTSLANGEFSSHNGYSCAGLTCFIFNQPAAQTVELCRFYDPVRRTHFYTTNRQEGLAKGRYSYEGAAGYVYTAQQPGTVPLYRFFLGDKLSYFYSTVKEEGLNIQGAKLDTTQCYVYPPQ